MRLCFVVVVLVSAVAAAPTNTPYYLPIDPTLQPTNNTAPTQQQQQQAEEQQPNTFPGQQAKPKKYDRCVFVHGLGQATATEAQSGPHSALTWSKSLVNHTHQCNKHIFLSEDTGHNAWFDDALSQSICQHALAPQNNTDPNNNNNNTVIKNTMFFSYSMGTVSLAAAFDSGHCSMDDLTSSWHAIGFYPPFTKPEDHPTIGDALHKENGLALRDQLSRLNLTRSLKGFYSDDEKSYSRGVMCSTDGPVCENNISQQRKERILKVIQSKVSSAMCGTSSRGFVNQDAALVIVAKMWSKKDFPSDGVVSFNQCAYIATEGKRVFQKNPLARYYKGKMNHVELVCSNPDGENDDEKPCAWFESRE